MQERIERSRAGRVALSILLVALLGSMAVANLPASQLRETLVPVTGPVIAATGLDQRWAIFAPAPRTYGVALEARVEFRDGSSRTWRAPEGGALFGAYWDYRWRKLEENFAGDERTAPYWPGLAAFAARRLTSPGREPVRVTLWSITRPPGAAARARPIYRVPVGPA